MRRTILIHLPLIILRIHICGALTPRHGPAFLKRTYAPIVIGEVGVAREFALVGWGRDGVARVVGVEVGHCCRKGEFVRLDVSLDRWLRRAENDGVQVCSREGFMWSVSEEWKNM
jgi:hypothetical protein